MTAALRRHLPALAAAVAVVLFGAFALRHLDDPIEEVDEVAVAWSTGYLDLYLEGRFDDPAWRGFDALDHPPAWKYLYGFVRAAASLPRPPPETKARWHDRAWAVEEEAKAFSDALNDEVPRRELHSARLMSALACVVGLVLLGLLLSRAGPASEAWGAVAAVSAIAVFRRFGARGLIDGPLFATLVAAAWLTARWLACTHARRRLVWALALALTLGVLAQLKITGGVGLLAVVAAWVWVRRAEGVPGAAPGVGALAAVIAGAAAVALALNPSQWSDPIGFPLQMLSHRAAQVELQRALFDPMCGLTAVEAAQRFVWRTLLRTDPLYLAVRAPLVATLVLLGALAPRASTQGSTPGGPAAARVDAARAAATTHLGAWALLTAATYRLDWPRYIIPALPFLAWLAARGVGRAIRLGTDALRRVGDPGARTQSRRGLAVAMVAGLALAQAATAELPGPTRAERWAARRPKVDAIIAALPAEAPLRRRLEATRDRVAADVACTAP
jgi:4-amino-4-deoxy-L-arabinose transferase-like glycosyltransferase